MTEMCACMGRRGRGGFSTGGGGGALPTHPPTDLRHYQMRCEIRLLKGCVIVHLSFALHLCDLHCRFCFVRIVCVIP